VEPLSLRIVEFLEDKFFSPHFPVGAFFFADFLTGLLFQGDDVGLLAIQPVNKENKKIQQRSVRWLNLEI
tara:strand:- start:14 stop:223 length:210 start_codon:yes stop_codon:yes gene_type:complete